MAYIESIEMAELHHPILIRERMLLADTEGAGKYCGAPSLRIAFETFADKLTLMYASDGTINRAEGICGGEPGGAADQYMIDPHGNKNTLPAAAQLTVEPGQTIVSVGTGGGGYGEPRQREPKEVVDAVRSGLMSAARAAEVYGVALQGDELDAEATAVLRTEVP
jgi:N-methylhydantoinase B